MNNTTSIAPAIKIGTQFQVLGQSGNKLIFVLRGVKDSPVLIYVEDEGKLYTSGLGLLCRDMEDLKTILKLLGHGLHE